MPVPSQFGVFASGSSGGGGGPAFVTATGYLLVATSQVVSFSGAAVGDLAIITVLTSTTPVTISGWTALPPFSWNVEAVQSVLWRVLTSGDISTGSVTVTGLNVGVPLMFAAYGGVTSAALKSTGDLEGPGALSIPGFTKSVSSKIIVTFMFLFSSSPASGPLVAPGLSTTRIPSFPSSADFLACLADILPSSSYTDGSALVWTGSSVDTQEQVAQAVELT